MSTDIEKERLRLNREAARLLCRLDEIKKRLRELWKEQTATGTEIKGGKLGISPSGR
jgi:hypothetical protein